MDPNVAAELERRQAERARTAAEAEWGKTWGLRWDPGWPVRPLPRAWVSPAQTLVAEVPESDWDEAWFIPGPGGGPGTVLLVKDLLNGTLTDVNQRKKRVSGRHRRRWTAHGAEPVRAMRFDLYQPDYLHVDVVVTRSPLGLVIRSGYSAEGEDEAKFFVRAVAAKVEAAQRSRRP